jgi:hypothetical protein
MALEMLDILAPEEMRALLRTELRADGWREGEDGELERTIKGARARLDAEGTKIVVEQTETKTIRASSVSVASARARVEKAKTQAEAAVQRELVKGLLKVEPEVREAVQQALQRTYVVALKRKAASLGEISGIQEARGEQGELELTIKIKV